MQNAAPISLGTAYLGGGDMSAPPWQRKCVSGYAIWPADFHPGRREGASGRRDFILAGARERLAGARERPGRRGFILAGAVRPGAG